MGVFTPADDSNRLARTTSSLLIEIALAQALLPTTFPSSHPSIHIHIIHPIHIPNMGVFTPAYDSNSLARLTSSLLIEVAFTKALLLGECNLDQKTRSI